MRHAILLRRIAPSVGLLLALALRTPAAPPAANSAAPDPALNQKAENFLGFAAAVRADVLRPQDCPFDPAAVVLRVGTDPEKLAGFVRDHIRYEPYCGVVRGAEGTLAAGCGGDWDRAVLLRALLTEAGYATTLRVLPRSDTDATAVVDAFLKRDSDLIAMGQTPDPDAARLPPPPPVLSRFNIPAGNRLLHWQQATADWRRNLLESLDAAAAQVPVIQHAFTADGSAAPFEKWRAALLTGAAQRVVIEITTPDGPRVISPGPETAEPAKTALDAAETVRELPADRVATLTLRLSMKPPSTGGDAEPVVILERSVPVGSLFRTAARLEVVPADEKAAAKPSTSWTPDEWFKNVSGFQQFQAILHVGRDTAASKVFDLSGQLHEVSSDGRIAGASQMGGSAMGGFAGLGGGGGEKAAPAARIEALTLEIEMTVPGGAPAKAQRLLYGKLCPNITPISATDLLASGGPVAMPTELWLALDAATADAPFIAAQIRTGGRTPPDAAGLADAAADFVRMPALLYDWQLGRLGLAGRILASRPTLTALAGPSVILRSEQLTIDAKAKRVGSRTAVDVVFDELRIVPRTADAVAAAVDANQTLGVASTVLESVLLNRVDPSASAHGPFAMAQEALLAGKKPVVRAAGTEAGQADPLAEWAIAHNERDRALVFPSESAADTWWAIDPATGATIGRGAGGEGQSYIEYLNIVRINLINLKCCLAFAKTFLQGEPEGYEAMACFSGLDNPGTYVGGVGAAAEVYEVGSMGGFFAKFGDCLYGVWDYYH